MKYNNIKTIKLKNIAIDTLFSIIGTSIVALGIYLFTAPNNIAPGGVSGIATMVQYLFGFRLGLVSLAINIPLLILAWFKIGKEYTIKSILSTLVFFLVYDYIYEMLNVPQYTSNPLLAAIFGGVLTGFGLAIIFLRGGSSAGTDILGRFFQKKYPHISIGKMLLYIDAVIVFVSMIVFSSLEVSMYALITIYVSAKMIDTIIYGGNASKMVYIISPKADEISEYITLKMQRGATFLSGRGAYLKKDVNVLICAMRLNEFPQLKKFIHEIDPQAFVIASDASEIFGEGFKEIKEEL